MIRKIYLVIVAWVICMPMMAQHRADQQHLNDPKSFTLLMFGDPQNYVKVSFHQPIFELCTVWMADNIENLNVKAVLFTGDMVNRNEWVDPRSKSMDQTSKQQWNWVSHCLKRLDNKVPYIIAAGNHDYGYQHGDGDFTHVNEVYTYERNSTFAKCLVSSTPNREGRVSLENSAYEFTDANWGKMLVITTEWAPRDTVVNWAKKLCTSEKYKDHMVILNTHSFLKTGNPADRTKAAAEGTNQGTELWEKLVKPCSNVRLVLCGHTGKEEQTFEKNTGFRKDKNDAGKDVYQIMFNCQFLGGGNGGDGWVRIMEFMPDGKTIKNSTYSPLFGISPMTKEYAHRTGKCDQFDITIKR